MLNVVFKSPWLIVGPWIAALAVTVAASTAMGANLSTTALLLALGIAPAIVIALLANGEPSRSVAQVLYAVETNDGRS
jgi:hypothetical protein